MKSAPLLLPRVPQSPNKQPTLPSFLSCCGLARNYLQSGRAAPGELDPKRSSLEEKRDLALNLSFRLDSGSILILTTTSQGRVAAAGTLDKSVLTYTSHTRNPKRREVSPCSLEGGFEPPCISLWLPRQPGSCPGGCWHCVM